MGLLGAVQCTTTPGAHLQVTLQLALLLEGQLAQKVGAEEFFEAILSYVGPPPLQGSAGSGGASSERPWSGS